MPSKDYQSEKYGVLYYKNTNIIGLRRKWGGKEQVISYGGRGSKAEEFLRNIADDALKKLDAGETESEVRDWCKRFCK